MIRHGESLKRSLPGLFAGDEGRAERHHRGWAFQMKCASAAANSGLNILRADCGPLSAPGAPWTPDSGLPRVSAPERISGMKAARQLAYMVKTSIPFCAMRCDANR